MKLTNPMVHLIKDSRGYTVRVDGPIAIRIPKAAILMAIRAASQVSLAGDGGDPDVVTLAVVGAFWDELQKGFQKVSSITKNPLVATALKFVPYGTAASTAIDAAGAGIALGRKALQKRPKPIKRLVRKAARGDGDAKRQILTMRSDARRGDPEAKRAFAEVEVTSRLLADIEQAQEVAAQQESIEQE